MTITKLVTIALILVTVGFFAGRLSKPAAITTTDKTEEVTKTHEKTKTVIVTKPDGTTETVIVVDKDIVDKKKEEVKQVVLSEGPKINVNLMAGVDYHKPLDGAIYGLSVSKSFIGINVGVFGMTNGVVGVTAGMSF